MSEGVTLARSGFENTETMSNKVEFEISMNIQSSYKSFNHFNRTWQKKRKNSHKMLSHLLNRMHFNVLNKLLSNLDLNMKEQDSMFPNKRKRISIIQVSQHQENNAR